jgi:ubiquitin-activating enzyme E1
VIEQLKLEDHRQY